MKLKITVFCALMSTQTFAATTMPIIVCSANKPQFIATATEMKAANVGAVLVLIPGSNNAYWASSGSINSLIGKNTVDGITVTNFGSTGGRIKEKITNIDSDYKIYETYPSTHEYSYDVTLAESNGGIGQAHVWLSSLDPKKVLFGGGSWKNNSGSSVKFNYCTSLVEFK